MKRVIFCCWVLIWVGSLAFAQSAQTTPPVQSQPTQKGGLNLELVGGFHFSYTDATVLIGDDELENHLVFAQALAEGKVTIADTIAVTLQVGYNMNYPSESLAVQQMPLSLQLDRPKFYGLVIGAGVSGDIVSWSDWAVRGKAAWQYQRGNNKQWTITLSAASGTADVYTSINLFTAELALTYDGFSNVTIFAGPELFLLSGRYVCAESIVPTGETTSLTGAQELTFKQKNVLGVMAGALFEISDQWQIIARVSLLSRIALSASFCYVF